MVIASRCPSACRRGASVTAAQTMLRSPSNEAMAPISSRDPSKPQARDMSSSVRQQIAWHDPNKTRNASGIL